MTFKVIQGLVGNSDKISNLSRSDSNSQNSNNLIKQATKSATASSSTSAVTEAVVTTIRSTQGRPSSGADKIKNFEQAKGVAKKVAEDIRDEESALDAHSGLDQLAKKGGAREALL